MIYRILIVHNSLKNSIEKGTEEIKGASSCIYSFDNPCGTNKHWLVIICLQKVHSHFKLGFALNYSAIANRQK